MPKQAARTRSLVAHPSHPSPTSPAANSRLVPKKLRFTQGTVARVEAFCNERGKKPADAWRAVVWAGLQALNVPAPTAVAA